MEKLIAENKPFLNLTPNLHKLDVSKASFEEKLTILEMFLSEVAFQDDLINRYGLSHLIK